MGEMINLSHVDVDKMHAEEMARRQSLLENAKAGDVGALIVLHERYGLRLPLIEASLRRRGVGLPWVPEALPPRRLRERPHASASSRKAPHRRGAAQPFRRPAAR
jgi:hypothetical protein